MAYAGYLVKIGNYTLPHSYIKVDSYSVFSSITDLDSYTDANGVLHRNALQHRPNKCEFETPAMLDNTQFAELMSHIRENYINEAERKALVTLYIPEFDNYVTQEMYMPDIKPAINYINPNTGKIKYNPIRLAFIGY